MQSPEGGTHPQSAHVGTRRAMPYRAVIGSTLAAAAAYLGFVLWTGWTDVLAAVARIGWVGLAVALLLSLVNYALRFIRWQMYLWRMGYSVPWKPSLEIYLGGFALTTTPGKAGEAFRGILLKAWNVPYPPSFAAFVSERLSDLLAVVVLALPGLAAFAWTRPLVAVSVLVMVVMLVLVANPGALLRLRNRLGAATRMARVLSHGIDVMLRARACHTPGVVIFATVLSVLAWAAQAWAFHLIVRWMGVELSPQFTIFVFAVAMLAGALSFLPGGLGGTEAVMVLLLTGAGMSAPDALTATIVSRLVSLWFAVALGLSSLLLVQRRTMSRARARATDGL